MFGCLKKRQDKLATRGASARGLLVLVDQALHGRTKVLGCLMWLLSLPAGCGEQTIEHDGAMLAGAPGATASATASGASTVSGATGAAGEGGGNFPEPAQTRCGPPIGDAAPLTQLGSAWAVVALPGAVDSLEQNVEAGSARLRFASVPLFDCAAQLLLDEWCGEANVPECAWGIGLTLSPKEFKPGEYLLSELENAAYTVSTMDLDGEPTNDRAGTLILHSITANCVVGELRDIEVMPGEQDQNGSFVAERCQRQCIPGPNQGC